LGWGSNNPFGKYGLWPSALHHKTGKFGLYCAPKCASRMLSPSFIGGLLSGLVSGFVSGYILLVLQDRRKAQKELSQKAYGPLHEQLFRTLPQIQKRERPLAFDLNFWTNLEAAGQTKFLTRSVQRAVSRLYKQTLPSYDAVWKDAQNEKMLAILRKWDDEFGSPLPQPLTPLVRDPGWWQFLTSETFEPPLVELRSDESLAFWNMVLKNDRLKQLGIHTEAIPGAALGRGSKQPSSATLPEPPRRSTEGNPARYRSGFQADPMKTRVRTKLKQPLWSTVIHLRNDHLCRKDCGDRFPNPHILCGQSLRFFVCPNHILSDHFR